MWISIFSPSFCTGRLISYWKEGPKNVLVLPFLVFFLSRIDAFLEDVLIKSHWSTQKRVSKIQSWPSRQWQYPKTTSKPFFYWIFVNYKLIKELQLFFRDAALAQSPTSFETPLTWKFPIYASYNRVNIYPDWLSQWWSYHPCFRLQWKFAVSKIKPYSVQQLLLSGW